MKIVADGSKRYREACDYDSVRRRLRAEAERRYEASKAGASIWRRIRIAITIHREVEAELEKMFPSGSLHAQLGSKPAIDGVPRHR